MTLTKNQIKVLHVAKGQLALDDDMYRDSLEANAGVRSAKDLDYQGFKAVMEHFERCGFKSKLAKRPSVVPPQSGTMEGKRRVNMATAAMIRKIYASWWSLGGSYYEHGKELKALRGFLKKRFRVDHENFLTFEQAQGVIEAIKRIGQE